MVLVNSAHQNQLQHQTHQQAQQQMQMLIHSSPNQSSFDHTTSHLQPHHPTTNATAAVSHLPNQKPLEQDSILSLGSQPLSTTQVPIHAPVSAVTSKPSSAHHPATNHQHHPNAANASLLSNNPYAHNVLLSSTFAPPQLQLLELQETTRRQLQHYENLVERLTQRQSSLLEEQEALQQQLKRRGVLKSRNGRGNSSLLDEVETVDSVSPPPVEALMPQYHSNKPSAVAATSNATHLYADGDIDPAQQSTDPAAARQPHQHAHQQVAILRNVHFAALQREVHSLKYALQQALDLLAQTHSLAQKSAQTQLQPGARNGNNNAHASASGNHTAAPATGQNKARFTSFARDPASNLLLHGDPGQSHAAVTNVNNPANRISSDASPSLMTGKYLVRPLHLLADSDLSSSTALMDFKLLAEARQSRENPGGYEIPLSHHLHTVL